MNSSLITLASRHNWQANGLQINQAVWELKNMLAVDVLHYAGYITQHPHGYGFNYRLTGKAIEWLIDNGIMRFSHESTEYNIFVRDISKTMIRYGIEQFCNEDDEYIVVKNITRLLHHLQLVDGYDYKTATVYVFNPLSIFESRAVKGVDYIIVEKE